MFVSMFFTPFNCWTYAWTLRKVHLPVPVQCTLLAATDHHQHRISYDMHVVGVSQVP